MKLIIITKLCTNLILLIYLRADLVLERASLRSEEEGRGEGGCVAPNLGDPKGRAGESQREGEEATICRASRNHSCVNLALLLLVLSSNPSSS